jgi:hypothetical protein
MYTDRPSIKMQLDAKAKARTFRAPMAAPASAEAYEAKGTPDEDKNVAAAKAIDALFESGKEADLLAGLAGSDMTLNFGPGTIAPKDMKKELHDFLVTFPKQKWTIENAWGVGDYAILEHTMSSKQAGPMGPVPASKRDVAWHWVDVTQFKDGKPLHDWGFSDFGELLAQIAPPKPVAPPGGPAAPPVKKDDAKKGDAKKDAPK